jgi:hypothetical protein
MAELKMPEINDEDIIPVIKHVVFRKCTPAWELPKHKTDALNLTYLVQGKAHSTIDDKSFDLTQTKYSGTKVTSHSTFSMLPLVSRDVCTFLYVYVKFGSSKK